jgi:hypothetical protein
MLQLAPLLKTKKVQQLNTCNSVQSIEAVYCYCRYDINSQ